MIKRRVFLNKRLIFIFLCLISLLNCDGQSQKEKYPPLATYYPTPTEHYPEGYSDVKMGDVLLRVPRHIAPVDPRGSFAIYVSWPEFEFVRAKNFRSTPMQNYIDKISIFFSPPRQGLNDGEPYQQGLEAKARKTNALKLLEYQWIVSTEFPGFKETNTNKTKPTNYYMSTDQNLVDPFGLPQIFFCDTLNRGLDWDQVKDHSKSLPQCNIGIDWPSSHHVRIRFQRKHMKDAVKIYRKVIALHDSFIVQKTKFNHTSGE